MGTVGALTAWKVISNLATLRRPFVRHAVSTVVISLALLLLVPIAWLHLRVFDKRLLEVGEVERLV